MINLEIMKYFFFLQGVHVENDKRDSGMDAPLSEKQAAPPRKIPLLPRPMKVVETTGRLRGKMKTTP